jgi:hypothetical protein
VADFIRAKSYDLCSSDPGVVDPIVPTIAKGFFTEESANGLVLCGLICGGHEFLVRQRMQQGSGGLSGVFAGDEIGLEQTMSTENIVA